MTNEPKLHHYVPRAYLKRFSSNNKGVYVLYKGGEDVISRGPVNVKNLCAEKDFYTVADCDDRKNIKVEQILAKFENENPNEIFSVIPPDLLYPFQNGGIVLDARQKIRMADAVAVQIVRGKYIREYGASIMGELYDELWDDIRRQYKGTPELAAQLENLKCNKRQIQENALKEGPVVELMKGGQSELMRLLRERVCFLIVNMTGFDFITSDEPVLVCDTKNERSRLSYELLGSETSAVYYPLDSKHMIALYAKEFYNGISNIYGNIMLLGDECRDFIEEVNRMQYYHCNRFLIAEKRENLVMLESSLR